MTDPSDELNGRPPGEHPPRGAGYWTRLALRAGLLSGAAVGVWWATAAWIAGDAARRDAVTQTVLPLGAMAGVVAVAAWKEWRWHRPRRRLLKLVPMVCAGRMPIEAVREVGGGMAPVAAAFAAVLHQVRVRDRKLAELEHETSLRVQGRTSALERTIGSLRLQAIRDPLTGLFNRRALDELFPRLLEHCRAKQEDLSVLMLDLDHFKTLNDQLGHAAGDEALRTIGQLVRSSLGRAQDAGFRCGGDEFVIVLPSCPPGPARQLAERLSKLVDAMARTLKVTPRPGLSVGVCSASDLGPGASPEDLLKEADRRLYETKRARHGSERRPAA